MGEGSPSTRPADRATWGLVETIDLVPLLESPGPPLLIDCLTLWLSRTMDTLDIIPDLSWAGLVEDRIAELAGAWSGPRALRLL